MKYLRQKQLRLVDVEQISEACPAAWTAATTDGRPVEISYRHGRLIVELNWRVIYAKTLGGPNDGSLDLDTALFAAGLNIAA